VVRAAEERFTRRFEEYFGQPADTPVVTLAEARDTLQKIENKTGVKSALIYVTFVPPMVAPDEATNAGSARQALNSKLQNSEDQLELLIVTSKGVAIRKRVDGSTRKQVLKVADEFRTGVTNVRDQRGYISPARQLYRWLVAPLEVDLKEQGIQNLAFIMDTGLLSIPLAALYDGQEFLVEKYNVGLLSSLSLTDRGYQDIKNLQVLAMGAATFTDQKSLPSVPLELSAITPSLWRGKSFLNNAFTLANLKAQRQEQPFGIIHLATHAVFLPGSVDNSYIQLWDTKLRLNELPLLGWNKPPVELLVLSACRTALGNEQAELGFAGLGVQAGVKSALGSLWFVSDEGTLGLMTGFYQELKQAPIKAEALRRAQVAMLKGQVRLEGGQLVSPNKSVPLSPELAKLGDKNFKHPYFWAGFTLVGSPW
jgi:CHAT domain-containing protein